VYDSSIFLPLHDSSSFPAKQERSRDIGIEHSMNGTQRSKQHVIHGCDTRVVNEMIQTAQFFGNKPKQGRAPFLITDVELEMLVIGMLEVARAPAAPHHSFTLG